MAGHARALVTIGAVTAVVGLLAAWAVSVGLPSDQRSFAQVSAPVQLLISVGVPFLGAVMTYDLHRRTRGPLAPVLLQAVGLAVGFAIYGAIVTAVAVAAVSPNAPQGRWRDAIVVVLGSVLVQVVAQLIGTGFGLLVRRPVVACLATIVIPLGLWLLLGVTVPQARAWLTPLEPANHLVAGTMTTPLWLPYVVMVTLWGLGLNLAGYRRLRTSGQSLSPSGGSPA